jgi:hypothetical protein
MLGLVLLDLGAGEKGHFLQRRLGLDVAVLIEAVVREDFAEHGFEFGVLKGAQAGGIERFLIGDVVAGSTHGYGKG